MDIWAIFLTNLLSPAILFFCLGIAAGFFKSDLEVPESISRYLAIYLMMAIGFKGGASLAATESAADFLPLMLAGVGMSFLVPFAGYLLLSATTAQSSQRNRNAITSPPAQTRAPRHRWW